VGDAYPNAPMESIIGLFKTEAIATTVLHDGPYKALADVEYVVPAGSTGTTTDACTGPSASPRSSTSRTTTLPSAESRNAGLVVVAGA
jgi:hypothetical protein